MLAFQNRTWPSTALPTPEMVTFDGTNDYLTKASGLTGAADSQYVAGYLKFNRGANTSTEYLLSSTGEAIAIRIDANGDLNIRLENSGGTIIMFLFSVTAIDDGADHEVWWSYDGATGSAELYLDGSDDLSSTILTTGTADLTLSDWGIGAFYTDAAHYAGDLERLTLWITDATGFSDFDVTSASVRTDMADVNEAASLGNGSENILDFYGPPATWNAGTNNGQGGDFTMNGSVA